uniref:RNA binding motif protein 12Ba n=1 Tax=Amphiprion percula TaxID=161767 RepID=A0A3P8RRH2_AMPPE
MYIILRLQGLDVKAGVEDIRAFFQPLHIPDGGVVIVGGILREAFIAFTSERHAQLAMRRTGNLLKGSEVTMHISLQSSQPVETNKAAESPKVAASPKAVASDGSITPEQPVNSKPGYVRLFGLPASTTKEDICRFFTGLTVQEAIVNVQLGLNHGCLVKFANMQDARDALCFNQQPLGQICVEVRGGTEKMWNSALQECETASKVEERSKPKQNPLRENHKQKSPLKIKRGSINLLPSKPAKKPKIVAAYTPPPVEHIVMVNKLPKEINKTEIKELFGCPNIPHKNVIHLLDKYGSKTDTIFLIFDRTEDYEYALNLSGCHVGATAIQVLPITEQMMREKMSKNLDRTGQIGRLFYRFRLTQDSIIVLHDSNGNGLGEALVQFDSEKTASFAYKMHGKKYLGAKLLFTRISERQMDDILNKRAFVSSFNFHSWLFCFHRGSGLYIAAKN